MTSLDILRDEFGYRIGDCQILRYDPARIDIFPEGFISQLYFSLRASSPSTLPNLFCGMPTLTHDAITTYLITRPLLLIPVVWDSPSTFTPAGIAFPTTICGVGRQRSIFAGYGFTRQFWGTPEAEVLMMLGLAYLALEMDLRAVHGIRYQRNRLTARFTQRFGFREIGTIPRYMLLDGELTDGVVSTLLREDLEKYVEKTLKEAFGGGREGR